MNLTQAQNLTVHCINPDSETESPRSKLYRDGVETGAIVDGAILEAAIQWDRRLVLFLNNNCPFEETLNIQLLDEELKILDVAWLFWAYSTGSFSDLELIQPNIIKFRFFDDFDWRVELLDRPAFLLPLFTERNGVWRHWRFSRHFKVRDNTRPPRRRTLPEVLRDWTAGKTRH